MTKAELRRRAWERGRTYAERSGMTMDQMLAALQRGAIREFVAAGLGRGEVVEMLGKGYKGEQVKF